MVRRPYPTSRDQTHPPTASVWRALRELRAAPPGRATSGSRQKLFSSALEQSEQLFTAAGSVGPASRPLVLFYGLSQAGRAIAPARRSRWMNVASGVTESPLRRWINQI
ncbi:YaaC family protein [Streptomyces albidoflavus]|uniref:YaaC family protein n=1 Tax=Streptomyces albidoflavus TaxID=1886 RepID=UPI00374CF10C